MKRYVPTSVVLDDLLKGAAEDYVTLEWLLDSLSKRSFGIVMLILGLIALVPGTSGVIVVLLLGVLLLIPIPFSQVAPGLVIMLLSFAYLEEDGVVLCLALAAALVTLALAGAAVWATVRGIDFLDRFW